MLVILGILAFYYFTKSSSSSSADSYGCNIEDDDIRRDALISRIEIKKGEKQRMKQHLQGFLQEKMAEMKITDGGGGI